MKYFDNWDSHEAMVKDFADSQYNYEMKKYEYPPIEGMATDDEVLYAQYGNGSYDGCCRVLFARDGKLYRVDGSHCSCYGLESQWSPEETSWAAEAMRPRKFDNYDMSEAAQAAFWALVDAHVPPTDGGGV